MRSLADGRVTLHAGDCLRVLKTLPENSVDSVVCDPPYGLAFMGRHWDAPDNVAHRPDVWREALRVLKPGGHLVAFGGTRTYHRLAVAIEDAGFEIRDQLAWVYGSGFPKSLDVSKAIDKAAGAKRETIATTRAGLGRKQRDGEDFVGAAHFEALKRIDVTAPATLDAATWSGFGTALKPALEPICLARKPLSEPTVAANVLRWGTGALDIDGCRIEATEDWPPSGSIKGEASVSAFGGGLNNSGRSESNGLGRWPANLVHDGSPEALAAFPQVSNGVKADHLRRHASNGVTYGSTHGQPKIGHADSGSAARFFYCAKASRAGRAGSKHPTVKPLKLMRWLVRLVTPPGGVALDLFAGTGTTAQAALAEGFRAVLIEREAEFRLDIARRLRTSAVGSRQSAVGSRQSAVGSRQEAPKSFGDKVTAWKRRYNGGTKPAGGGKRRLVYGAFRSDAKSAPSA